MAFDLRLFTMDLIDGLCLGLFTMVLLGGLLDGLCLGLFSVVCVWDYFRLFVFGIVFGGFARWYVFGIVLDGVVR